ncbi:bifunctional 3-oxoadipate enol-lactonase/4-carboxymuconolactone decarboxylase PcaDC [Antarcticirhabdus aurantiaca]|uniref:bifunctional 3-oxoadipate enol-lactonase/4-carboxymuconolactone decarboxylase PcaDC n=1 Tax=Antarcticirhabdus aurantiaca TaxID=2606717 RepID=UPI00131CACE1|nr:3-oxoadipate enol-lactonase [Antarcticirhabdus aurantiaca]
MAFVTANGIAIHHRLAGRRGAPRLVFLNSLGSDLRIWDDVVARLSDSFEILLVDKRGHGLSETTPGPYSIPLLAGDLTALLDALDWRAASIVGLSIGGLIAQHVAIHAPERVERLVLMDTAARIGTSDAWNERIAAVRAGGVASIGEAVVSRWFSDGYAGRHPARFAAWRAMLEATPAEGYAAACAAVRDADYREAVAHIATPTLAIAGDADKPTPPDLVRDTAGRIPGARFELVAGAGHLPCLERPAEIAALIASHLGAEVEAPNRFEAGMAVRRAVLGDAHVDRASAAATPFDAPFQRFITEGAWGSVWSRPHFTRRERSIVTLALLAALGQDEELAMHVRATRNTGASAEDVVEALMHVAVYAGVPAANHAIKIAKTTFAEMEEAAR